MKGPLILMLVIFLACSGNNIPDAQEVYEETWENFEYMADWQQDAISCNVVIERGYENYPDPNKLEEFKQYFFDHKANAGIPEDKSITEWTDEEYDRWSKSIGDNPNKFIATTPEDIRRRYKSALIDHIRYVGSDIYANCIGDYTLFDEYGNSYFEDNTRYYMEMLEFLIYDVLENTNVELDELCLIGFSIEIAVENITYNNPEFSKPIWCRDNW